MKYKQIIRLTLVNLLKAWDYIMKTFAVLLFVAIAFFGCSQKPKGEADYIKQIENWHKHRVERLKADNGWLNLVGIFWLKRGENTFGYTKDNDLVLTSSKLPDHIGSFFFADSVVTFKANDGVNVLLNGNPVKEIVMKGDEKNDMTLLQVGSVRFNLIIRDTLYGIRARDLNSSLVKNFKGVEYFPIDQGWDIKARYEAYNPPKDITVPNILGQMDKEKSPGAVVFERNGKTYKIDAVDEGGDNLFLIIADETTGDETYGGGRFLYVKKPDSTGTIDLDFNKAYNPPCVFTRYATCPLPPEQNYLKLKIEAGEKMYGEGH
jgi:uncharacterized protein (DUF1684 family)